MTTDKVGVIGLGNMGLAMAATLRKAGFDVTGHDPSPDRAALAAGQGIATTATAADTFRAAPVVVLSLPKAQHVEAVLDGDDSLAAAGDDAPGRLVIDTTTSEPDVTRRLAQRLSAAGHSLVDAPVSGGPAGAASGSLTMMVGGDDAAIARARPVLDALSAKITRCGAVGCGHVVKLVNNLLCAAHLLTAGEALRLGTAAGVDPRTLIQALNAGSGRSGVTEVNVPKWVLSGTFDSGFTMGLMRKDVGLALKLADEAGVDMALSQTVAQLWRDSAATLDDGADFNRIADPDATLSRLIARQEDPADA